MQQTAEIATTKVPNPYRERLPELKRVIGEWQYFEDQVEAVQPLHDDPLGQMYHRRQLGKDRESLRKAGRLYQTTYETAYGLRGRSPSDLREHVDGGRLPRTGTTDAQMAASDRIHAWDARLGDDAGVLVAVLIHKLTIRQIADAGTAMMPGKAATTFYGHLFRRQLSTLAKAMGFG